MATYVQTVDVGHLTTTDVREALTLRSPARLDRTATLALTVDVLRCGGITSF